MLTTNHPVIRRGRHEIHERGREFMGLEERDFNHEWTRMWIGMEPRQSDPGQNADSAPRPFVLLSRKFGRCCEDSRRKRLIKSQLDDLVEEMFTARSSPRLVTQDAEHAK